MQCRNCGGRIEYKANKFVCENCGATFDIDRLYESVDVVLCYTEFDHMGRRTIDSIICEKIYTQLESANLRVFYQRNSIPNMSEDVYERIYISAISSSKIIVMFGSNERYFNDLYSKYKNVLEGKIIIPVYKNITANQLPDDLKKIESIDYNKAGAEHNLVSNILKIFGRKITTKSKRNVFLPVLIAALSAIVILLLTVIFNTDLILDSKKYEKAIELEEKGKYIEAINKYSTILNYKDSKNRINDIYNKYEGYYTTDDDAIHIDITESQTLNLEIKKSAKKNIKIITSAQVKKNKAEFTFVDTNANEGNGCIVFENDGIILCLSSSDEENTWEEFFDEVKLNIDSKSDFPIQNTVSFDMIKNWILTGISKTEIEEQGYELSKIDPMFERDMRDNLMYNIDNTDIKIVIDYNCIVCGATAPAELVIPESINNIIKPYDRDGLFYMPLTYLRAPSEDHYSGSYENVKIVKDGYTIREILASDSRIMIVNDNKITDSVKIHTYTTEELSQEETWKEMQQDFYRSVVKRNMGVKNIDLTEESAEYIWFTAFMINDNSQNEDAKIDVSSYSNCYYAEIRICKACGYEWVFYADNTEDKKWLQLQGGERITCPMCHHINAKYKIFRDKGKDVEHEWAEEDWD